MRLSQLRKLFPYVSKKMLTQHLREMVEAASLFGPISVPADGLLSIRWKLYWALPCCTRSAPSQIVNRDTLVTR
jgi:hypothetical protein